MPQGRQLRLFLPDGTSSGPRFYEIVNRTIQALGIPVTRIIELESKDWTEVQKPGVYLVRGATKDAVQKLYIGRGENVAERVQKHPEKLDFEVVSLLLFTSKDQNLNASQVGWLEATLIRAARESKRVSVTNIATPDHPALPKGELATVGEFYEDLKLIAQTAGYDFFSSPTLSFSHKAADGAGVGSKQSVLVEFKLIQPTKDLVANGFLSDEGFVVKAGSDAVAKPGDNFKGGYAILRQNLIEQGVLIPKSGAPDKLTFAVDYPFSAPSAAAATIVGNNINGNNAWKTDASQSLGEYLELLSQPDGSASANQ
ncbi:MAG: hypothetical protein RIS56_1462 [Verrucomicrobiota bacterium]|jgi:hypothetical protein